MNSEIKNKIQNLEYLIDKLNQDIDYYNNLIKDINFKLETYKFLKEKLENESIKN